LPRFALTIEYDGTPYAGWQRQNDAHTVQAAIESAFYGFCQQDVALTAAGRTDAGVHARGQVAHGDLQTDRACFIIREGVNAWLRNANEAVRLVQVSEVADDFHARFHAVKRHYQYRILNRRASSPLDNLRCWHVAAPLDVEAMREGAALLVGKHDFSSFRDSQCQAHSPIRTLDTVEITEEGDYITLQLSALSFLHHQVRIMTGTLVEIGKGKNPPHTITAMLEAKNRAAAGQTAPAHGLYFMRVEYASQSLRE
jgi:tRNA pseudouridine38-40 synthase